MAIRVAGIIGGITRTWAASDMRAWYPSAAPVASVFAMCKAEGGPFEFWPAAAYGCQEWIETPAPTVVVTSSVASVVASFFHMYE
jgi:hypothetical protein